MRRVLPVLLLLVSFVLSACPPASAAGRPFGFGGSVLNRGQYLHDHRRTPTYIFAGSVTETGAVAVDVPAGWHAVACPTAPAGWSKVLVATGCRFVRSASSTNDLTTYVGGVFRVDTYTTMTSRTDVTGRWHVRGYQERRFAGTYTEGLGHAMETKAFALEITDVVVADEHVPLGGACPSTRHHAAVGAHVTLVVCASDHSDARAVPVATHSGTLGSFAYRGGTFSATTIRPRQGPIVLAEYDDLLVATHAVSNAHLVVRLGTLGHQASPTQRFDGFDVTSS